LMGNPKNRDSFHKAKALFERAIAADPNYAKAYAGLGFAYMFDYQNRWSEAPDSSLPLAKQYAQRAIEKNPKEPIARVVAAVTATFNRDLERAKEQFDLALSLNPSFSLAYNVLGSIYMYSGRPLDAIPMIERAMRLDPNNSGQYLHFLGSYLLAGKYETAVTLLRQRIAFVPGTDFSRALLASALGHLGEVDEARRVWKELEEKSALCVQRTLRPATL
jgi:adenylate cyclase